MQQILAVALKEFLLLQRDRAGLLVLFFMPAILVVIITLVQENIMEMTGQKKTEILFLDLDKGPVGDTLQQLLVKTNVQIIAWSGPQDDGTELKKMVQKGKYQVGIIIPADTSTQLERKAHLLLDSQGNKTAGQSLSIPVFFDPGIMAGLKRGITAQLEAALQTIALQTKLTVLEEQMRELLAMQGPGLIESLPQQSPLADLTAASLFTLQGYDQDNADADAAYNPVRQNVPAWALFGMFFTAIPIAGSVLQERQSGIWIRLATLPTSLMVLFAGKLLTYLGICLCQFFLIFSIGRFLFPILGLPAFTVAGSFLPLLLVIFCAGLAACGYGLFLGMVCSSYEKASTIGATTIVAAAALGGVMVPVYAMPQTMQKISLISPLGWGLSAFHDLLLRALPIKAIVDDLCRLLVFFLATAVLSWLLTRIRK